MGGTNRLKQLIAQIEPRATAALDYTAAQWEAGAWVDAPVDDGDLQGSIGHRKTGRWERTIDATAAHAAPQEFGSVEHAIPGAFGRPGSVQHPGNPEKPFMRPNRDKVAPTFRTMMRDILEL